MADCHECNCIYSPPCGACETCAHWDVTGCPTDCQECDRAHTGPYRLDDGTWSDGVDRSVRINTRAFGELNPDRIRVVCQRRSDGTWYPSAIPLKGICPESWDDFTHAEAIAYADRVARGGE